MLKRLYLCKFVSTTDKADAIIGISACLEVYTRDKYIHPSYALEKLNWKAEKGIEEMCRDSYNYILTELSISHREYIS